MLNVNVFSNDFNSYASKFSFFLNELREKKEKWQALGGLAWFPAVIFMGASLTRGSHSTTSHFLLSRDSKKIKMCKI